MECLNNIIGITKNVCDCLKDELTTDEIASLTVSNSGLFVDNIPGGGVDLKALTKSDVCKNLADIAMDAIDSASKQVSADLVVALTANYQKGLQTFNGTIGQKSYTGGLAMIKPLQGFLLRAKDGADAVIQISRIGLNVNTSVNDVVINIYAVPRGTSVGTLVKSYTVNTLANNFVYAVPEGGKLILPLSVNGQPMDYFIEYDSTFGGGFSPKDNKIKCNCPGLQRDFNVVGSYILPVGFQLDSTDDFSAAILDTTYTRGIIIDCQLRCNNEQLICGQYSKEEAIAVVLAWAMLYCTGANLIEGVMQTREINRYTMQDKEYLWGKRNAFIKEYQNRIAYLAANIDVNSSTCFICRDNQIYMSTINVTDGGMQNRYDTDIARREADYIGFNPNNLDTLPGVIDLSQFNLPNNN